MKWFFAGLLVANIVFLAWNAQQDGQVSSTVTADAVAANGASGLVLLRELGTPPPARSGQTEAGMVPASPVPLEPDMPSDVVAETRVETQPNRAPEELPAVVASCLRLGGFDSQSAVARIAGGLRQAGAQIRGEGEEAGELRRYWVMLPPYAKAAAAAPVLERLQRAGVKDYYLIRSGENMNAISLGVYSGTDSAQRRLRQIRDLKLAAKIEEITLPAKRWWLEFDWPEDQGESAWRTVLPREFHDIQPQACR